MERNDLWDVLISRAPSGVASVPSDENILS